MAKRLILLRHAKSAWNRAELADFERPLAPRGKKAAPVMGQFLAQQKKLPDLVLCSSARRAVETWQLIAAQLPKDIPARQNKALYMAMPREMLKLLQKTPDEHDCVLLIGHNPGIADLAAWLCAQAKDEKHAQLAAKFPTAAVAIIDFDVASWRDVEADSGRLIDFVTPRSLDS